MKILFNHTLAENVVDGINYTDNQVIYITVFSIIFLIIYLTNKRWMKK